MTECCSVNDTMQIQRSLIIKVCIDATVAKKTKKKKQEVEPNDRKQQRSWSCYKILFEGDNCNYKVTALLHFNL